MRLTALPRLLSLLSLSTLVACVAPVGPDPDTDPRPAKACDPGDEDIKVVSKNKTIRTAADFDDDDFPKGCFDLDGTLRIESPNVTSLEKLGKLASVTNLELINTKLTKLDLVEPLTVYAKIDIRDNTSLASLENLVIEQERAVSITIQNNAALTSLDGLGDLTKVDGDNISTPTVPGDFVIRNNAKLTSVKLARLNEVTGRFEISGNGALVKVEGLADLTTVGTELRISNNAALTTIDLANLETLKRFEISENAALTTVGGIRARTITGDLVVRGNRVLTSFGAMSSLDSVTGSVMIDNNAALTNLGMFTLTLRNTGPMTVSNNPQLTDLGAVSHISGAILGAVSVTNNVKLPYCKALEIDHCVTSGAVSIVGNLNTQMTNCDCWCD